MKDRDVELKLKYIKNKLSSYEYYQNELFKVNEELIVYKRLIEEPKATNYESDISTGGDINDRHYKFLDTLHGDSKLKDKQLKLELELQYCIDILESVNEEVSRIIYAKYVKRIRDEEISRTEHYNRSTLYRLIDRELKKILSCNNVR